MESTTPAEVNDPEVVDASCNPVSKDGSGRMGAGTPAIFTVIEVSQATAVSRPMRQFEGHASRHPVRSSAVR